MESQVQPKTEMTNPPKGTQMISPQKKGQKTYKLVVLNPFNVGSVEYKNGAIVNDSTRLTKKGEIIEVDRERAKDLCKPISGSYAFSGERYLADKDVPRHNLTRARLATPADLAGQGPLTPLDEEDVFGT